MTQTVNVNGVSYPVKEHAGLLKAYLNGVNGWKAVWADSYSQLVRRIKFALTGDL